MQTIQRSFQVNETVVSADLDNETVLLNVETGIYFGLDEIGTRIWSLLKDECSVEDIIRQLLDEYDIERALLEADMASFLNSLLAKGLITRGEG